MAYNTKYSINILSKNGLTGLIEIKKDGYVGDVTPLKLSDNGLTIDYSFNNWFDPIIGLRCDLTILNDKSSWYELEDLMTLDEREFRITINASNNYESVCLFDGFLNSDTVEQRYLKNSTFRLVGSSYLSKINNVSPPIIDKIGLNPLISIVNDSLNLTGQDCSVWVRNNLWPVGEASVNNKSCLNTVSIDNELFWKNNIEKQSGLDCIKKILLGLDSYIYWWDGKWFIERFGDLYPDNWDDPFKKDNQKSYVIYNSSTGYTRTSTVDSSIIYRPISNIFSTDVFHTGGQNMSMIPSLKSLDLKLNHSLRVNLTNRTFDNWLPANYIIYPYANPYFPFRNWYYPSGKIHNGFGIYYDISAAIIPQYYDAYNAAHLYMYNPSTGDTEGGGDITNGDNSKLQIAGISNDFTVTLDEVPTTLNLTWNQYQFSEDYNTVDYIDCNWVIKEVNNGYFLYYDDSSSGWFKVYTTAANAVNKIRFTEDSIEKATGKLKCSVDIPIWEFDTSRGDVNYVIGIAFPRFKLKSSSSIYLFGATYISDVVAKTQIEKRENLIKGELNLNNLNTETITLDCFSMNNSNYKNTFIWGTQNYRLDQWQYKDASTNAYTTAEWILGSKLGLYEKNRRVITSTIKHNRFIKPLSLCRDFLDPSIRTYAVTSYRYNVLKDTYDIEWWEYASQNQFNFTE